MSVRYFIAQQMQGRGLSNIEKNKYIQKLPTKLEPKYSKQQVILDVTPLIWSKKTRERNV
jgi:hypothetical protein